MSTSCFSLCRGPEGPLEYVAEKFFSYILLPLKQRVAPKRLQDLRDDTNSPNQSQYYQLYFTSHFVTTSKTYSHIAYRAHASPILFLCHAVPLRI